jgi:uncharacterized protein
MKKNILTAVFVAVVALTALIPPAAETFAASVGTDKRLFDEAGLYEESSGYGGEETAAALNRDLFEAGEKAGFYIAVLISADIGRNKSDRAVTDYADVYYEKQFGKNTDGILLFINMDTKYDWISTSGKCIDVFTDRRIDSIFDAMERSLKAGDFTAAIKIFRDKSASYAELGVPDGQYREQTDDERQKQTLVMNIVFFCLIADFIIAFIFVIGVKASYKISPVKDAGNYLDRSSVKYYQKSDTFIRVYVTKQRIDSSGGGGGGTGGRSSVHTSSGGGTHGGGGRHR